MEVIQFKTDWFWSYVYQTLSVIYAYTGPWKQRVFGNYYKLFAYLIWMHICLSMFDRNLAVTRIAQMLSDGVSFCRKQRHCGRGYKNVKDWINGGLNLKKNMKTRRVISITRRPTPISSARASFENGVPLPYIRLFSISVIEMYVAYNLKFWFTNCIGWAMRAPLRLSLSWVAKVVKQHSKQWCLKGKKLTWGTWEEKKEWSCWIVI